MVCCASPSLQRLHVESEAAKVRRSVEWLAPLLDSSGLVTCALQEQWKAVQRKRALVKRYLDDAQTALSASQQRLNEYPHLQSRNASFTGLTVPRHQEGGRRLLHAIQRMSAAESADADGEEEQLIGEEAASPVLSYASIAAALRLHEQRWTAVQAELYATHQRALERQATMSGDRDHSPCSPPPPAQCAAHCSLILPWSPSLCSSRHLRDCRAIVYGGGRPTGSGRGVSVTPSSVHCLHPPSLLSNFDAVSDALNAVGEQCNLLIEEERRWREWREEQTNRQCTELRVLDALGSEQGQLSRGEEQLKQRLAVLEGGERDVVDRR